MCRPVRERERERDAEEGVKEGCRGEEGEGDIKTAILFDILSLYCG